MSARLPMHLLRATLALLCLAAGAWAATAAPAVAITSAFPIWAWALLLFVFCLVVGIVATAAGVGGGVLFVPLVGAFFPFHMDFVRGAALFVALAGALSASSRFLRTGMTFPRLVLPLSVASSLGAIAGALVGLALSENIVRILLGATIALICVVMLRAKSSDAPNSGTADPIAAALDIQGAYREQTTGQMVTWRPRRIAPAIALFTVIGFVAGMFGLGAGWASVPALNLVMGVPLKAAVASSLLIISVSGTPPAMIYLNSGAVLPIITVPSVAGMMIGARIGTRLVSHTRPAVVRWFVIGLLGLSGALSLLKGFGVV